MPEAFIEQYKLNGELQRELCWDNGERDDREYIPLYLNPCNQHILERAILALEQGINVPSVDLRSEAKWIAADLRRELAKLRSNDKVSRAAREELDALRAEIAAAPVGEVEGSCGLAAVIVRDAPEAWAYTGQRVRLLHERGEE